MISPAVRSVWAESRAAGAPERVSRDWVLVGVLMVTALLEGALREDVTWRPFVTIVAVGLAPVLLWRRNHPLVCVVVGFARGTWRDASSGWPRETAGLMTRSGHPRPTSRV